MFRLANHPRHRRVLAAYVACLVLCVVVVVHGMRSVAATWQGDGLPVFASAAVIPGVVVPRVAVVELGRSAAYAAQDMVAPALGAGADAAPQAGGSGPDHSSGVAGGQQDTLEDESAPSGPGEGGATSSGHGPKGPQGHGPRGDGPPGHDNGHPGEGPGHHDGDAPPGLASGHPGQGHGHHEGSHPGKGSWLQLGPGFGADHQGPRDDHEAHPGKGRGPRGDGPPGHALGHGKRGDHPGHGKGHGKRHARGHDTGPDKATHRDR